MYILQTKKFDVHFAKWESFLLVKKEGKLSFLSSTKFLEEDKLSLQTKFSFKLKGLPSLLKKRKKKSFLFPREECFFFSSQEAGLKGKKAFAFSPKEWSFLFLFASRQAFFS